MGEMGKFPTVGKNGVADGSILSNAKILVAQAKLVFRLGTTKLPSPDVLPRLAVDQDLPSLQGLDRWEDFHRDDLVLVLREVLEQVVYACAAAKSAKWAGGEVESNDLTALIELLQNVRDYMEDWVAWYEAQDFTMDVE